MDDYKIIVEQEHSTVMAHYEVTAKPDGGYQSEAKLATDDYSSSDHLTYGGCFLMTMLFSYAAILIFAANLQ